MTAAIDPRSRELLAEAAEWRLLSLLFDCPGTEWHKQVAELAEEIHDPELQSCARQALDQATPGLYHSTFGPGGPGAPREVTYCDTLQLGYLMSELGTYYSSFGYHPQTEEPPDHISVEAGFLSFLRIKEAFAITSGDLEPAAVTAEAARRFTAEHLSRIARPLAARLAESYPGYFAGAADALLGRVGAPAPGLRGFNSDSPVQDEAGLFSCDGLKPGIR